MAEDVTGREEEELTVEEISSPLNTQILLEYYSLGLFADTIPSSEVDSCPNCNWYEENCNRNSNSSLLPKDADIHIGSNNRSTSCSNSSTATTGNLSAMFDAQDEIDDVSASINFSNSSPFYISPRFEDTEQDHYHNVVSELPPYPNSALTRNLLGLPLPLSSEDLTSLGITADPIIVTSGNVNLKYCVDTSGNFSGNALVSSEVMQPQAQVLDYQGDRGGFCHPNSQLNPGDIQALSNESQQLLNGHSRTPAKPSPPEMLAIDNRNFKVRRLSSEERKEKIHRYLKKRKERDFSKKIKYACRKTLADSRPRVRGRFAKNDDFVETLQRPNSSSHEEDACDDVVEVREEYDAMDSSDIFAHISGVNSFRCSYPIQSWI